MPNYPDITVRYGALKFSGHYTVEGAQVSVRSAYGSGKMKIGNRKPEIAAQMLLLEIVQTYCKR
jgi:hypothetical protein